MSRPASGRRHARAVSRRAHGAAAAVSILIAVVLVGTGLHVLIQITDFRQHAAFAGAALARTVGASNGPTALAAGAKAQPSDCLAPSDAALGQRPRLVLSIPSLGVDAPVISGVTDPTLDVAVGHEDGTSWPDQVGTDVLAAHDVTFFARISELRPGRTITLSDACRTWTFRVQGGQVVKAGSPVSRSTTGRPLVLVTCYPTNALYYTNTRYVLTAQFIGVTQAVPSKVPDLTGEPLVLPPGLPSDPAALSVDTVGIPLGTLTFGPNLSQQWKESKLGFQASNAATHLMVAGWDAARDRDLPEWNTLAPSVPINNATTATNGSLRWASLADVAVDGSGSAASGTTITAAVTVVHGGYRRAYRLTVSATVSPKNVLTISSWILTPPRTMEPTS